MDTITEREVMLLILVKQSHVIVLLRNFSNVAEKRFSRFMSIKKTKDGVIKKQSKMNFV
jgi:hypothetical protein